MGYSVFRDVDDLAGGQHWRPQLVRALAELDQKPFVVVLCTADAARASNHANGVLDELAVAKENDLSIVPIEFDTGAALTLLKAAGFEDAEQMQIINARSPAVKGRFDVDPALEDSHKQTSFVSCGPTPYPPEGYFPEKPARSGCSRIWRPASFHSLPTRFLFRTCDGGRAT